MKVSIGFFKYFKDYKFNSLFFRNVILLVVLIIIPFITAVIIGKFASDNLQNKEIEALSEKNLSDLYTDIKRILRESEMELLYFDMSTDVQLYLYDNEMDRYNYTIQSIQQLIKMPVIAKDYVENVYIYALNSNTVVGLSGAINYDSFPGKDAINAFLEQRAQENLMIREDNYGGYPKKYLSIFRVFQSRNQIKGISMMNLDVEELLKALKFSKDVDFYLIDNDIIILSNNLEMLGKEKSSLPEFNSVIQDDTVCVGEVAISSKKQENLNMEVLTYTEIGTQIQTNPMHTVMLVLLTVMIFITIGLAAMISVWLFRPIERIMTFIRENSEVLTEQSTPFIGRNEVEYILKTIEKTVSVKKNVDEELASRIKLLKKAQAVALQSQISPHFLNNTLESINWMAMESLGPTNEISEMVGSLSKMYRMVLENSDTVVPISMEISHCNYYLNIQKKRYEDKFDVEWDIPSEVMDCKIIRIVLQPLVENAIYHGIKRLSNKGTITIKGSIIEDREIVLTVSDNGIGMTEEELAELNESIQSDMIRESQHIGVSNVNQRLRLYFGEQYGLTVTSQEKEGTTVSIHFPKVL